MKTDDCYEAIRLISCNTIGSAKMNAPMVFSRNPDHGFELPHKWTWKSCSVLVDILDDEEQITLPLATIAAMALAVTNQCVTTPVAGGRGGRTRFMQDEVTLHIIVCSPQVRIQRTSALAADWMRAFGELPGAAVGPGQCRV